MTALYLFFFGFLSLFNALNATVDLDDTEMTDSGIVSCVVQSALLVITAGGAIGQFIYNFF